MRDSAGYPSITTKPDGRCYISMVMADEKNMNSSRAGIPPGMLKPSILEIAASILMAAATLVWLTSLYARPIDPGPRAEVYQAGRHAMTLDLTRDQSVVVGKMIVEVRDRRIRVSGSDCSRQVCVRQGWIHGPGQSIICAPNKVLVEIPFSAPDEGAVDAIVR